MRRRRKKKLFGCLVGWCAEEVPHKVVAGSGRAAMDRKGKREREREREKKKRGFVLVAKKLELISNND